MPTRFAFLPAFATVAIVRSAATHGEAEGAGDATFACVVAVADAHGDGDAATEDTLDGAGEGVASANAALASTKTIATANMKDRNNVMLRVKGR
jgi:hypothetical protein